MNAVRLYEKYTMEELVALIKQIEAENQGDQRFNHQGKPASDGLHLYSKPVRKKLDAIYRAISWHVEDRRNARS